MNEDRRNLLLGLLAGSVAASRASAQSGPPTGTGPLPGGLVQPTRAIDLWPAAAPGMPGNPPEETVEERSTDPSLADRAVTGITRPRMVVFQPRIPNGSSLVLTPGGGYVRVVIDKEGYELARWLNARGVTVFVLFYRLPGEGWADRANVPLADAQRAVRLVRHNAPDFALDPARVGAMGFSAGGHVCADLAARFDAKVYESVDQADDLSARPAIAAPIYPVVSMSLPVAHAGSRESLLGASPSVAVERAHSPQHNVPGNAPPHFLVHAEDDDVVPVENSLELRAALKEKRIPVETHLFAQGGHGFGLNKAIGKPVSQWPELFLNWAASTGFV